MIDSAVGFVEAYLDLKAVQAPTIAPTRSGGIVLSWNSSSHDMELEFVTPHQVEYSCLDIETDNPVSGEFAINRGPERRNWGERWRC